MATTFIDTGSCARVKLAGGQGEMAEVVNRALCRAENVTGMLRWLGPGEGLDAESGPDEHQLVYLMEGDGVIGLEGKDYAVAKGAGVYLGPGEAARVSQAGAATLKLFHLVVPRLAE